MVSTMKFLTYKDLFWIQEKKEILFATIVEKYMLCREVFGDIENLNV